MATTKKVVEDYKGLIQVESIAGTGPSFVLCSPSAVYHDAFRPRARHQFAIL